MASTDSMKNKQKRNNKKDSIWTKSYICVFIINAALYLSQQMMNSLVAKYADALGASATVVGIIVSMFAVSALIFKIIAGPASDAFNRKYILMGGMAIMAISYIGYSLSDTVPVLMSARLVQGVGQAFTTTCLLALAADTLPPDRYGSGIGFISMAQAAAQAIGPTVGLTLCDIIGYKATFLLAACIMLTAVLIASQISVNFGKQVKFKISWDHIVAKEAILPAVIIFFLAVAFSVINSFLVIFAERQGVSNIGYYFTVYAVTLLFTRPAIGRLQDRFGLVKVIIPAMFCFAGSFLIISCSTSLWMFLLAAFVAAFGYGACQPAIQTLALKCVPEEKRGAASSTNYIGTDGGNLVGPVLSGMIVERFGYVSMWRIMLIPMALSMAIVVIFRGRINEIEEGFQERNS